MKNNKWIVGAIMTLFLATIGGTWTVAGMVYELKIKQAVTETEMTGLSAQVGKLAVTIEKLTVATAKLEAKLEN